jgi:hypothetical protein
MPAILQQNYATEKPNSFNGLALLQKSCRPCEKSGAFAPIAVNAPKLAGGLHIAPKLTP